MTVYKFRTIKYIVLFITSIIIGVVFFCGTIGFAHMSLINGINNIIAILCLIGLLVSFKWGIDVGSKLARIITCEIKQKNKKQSVEICEYFDGIFPPVTPIKTKCYGHVEDIVEVAEDD